MEYRFKKHYTREEASALLPEVRQWLKQLREFRGALDNAEAALKAVMEPGLDLGGPVVNRQVRAMADLQGVLLRFISRELQIKDLDRGLVDFPAILAGREVFLCWEEGEKDIEFWHDLETGYAGRERL